MTGDTFTEDDVVNEMLDFLEEKLIFDCLVIPLPTAYSIVVPEYTAQKFWCSSVLPTLHEMNRLRYGDGVGVHAQPSGSIVVYVEHHQRRKREGDVNVVNKDTRDPSRRWSP